MNAAIRLPMFRGRWAGGPAGRRADRVEQRSSSGTVPNSCIHISGSECAGIWAGGFEQRPLAGLTGVRQRQDRCLLTTCEPATPASVTGPSLPTHDNGRRPQRRLGDDARAPSHCHARPSLGEQLTSTASYDSASTRTPDRRRRPHPPHSSSENINSKVLDFVQFGGPD